jgi:hypothetical protein
MKAWLKGPYTMASVKVTTLTVDFAGTREEARQFVAQHKDLHLAHKASPGEGLPMLTSRCTSYTKRQEVMAQLAALGWDEGSVSISAKVYAC